MTPLEITSNDLVHLLRGNANDLANALQHPASIGDPDHVVTHVRRMLAHAEHLAAAIKAGTRPVDGAQ